MVNSENEPEQPKGVLRETDDDARRLAKTTIRVARFGGLAALQPGTGHPIASRVAVATDVDGTPCILTSALSGHTSAILIDSRCSLLVGEPGKGDPLAHARVTLFANAKQAERGSRLHERLRRRYLTRHPKAELYVDFGDFSFFRLEIDGASLNGGFGKAYELRRKDLIIEGDLSLFSDYENGVIEHMNRDHREAVALYAQVLRRAPSANWRLAAVDPEGIDLVAGDLVERLWFDTPLETPEQLRGVLADLAGKARGSGR